MAASSLFWTWGDRWKPRTIQKCDLEALLLCKCESLYPINSGQPSNHVCDTPVDLLQHLHMFLVLDPRAGCSSPVGSPQHREEGQKAESPLSPCCTHLFGCSPGHCWLSEPQEHIARSCPAFHSSAPSSPSQWGCLQSSPLQIVGAEGCSNSGAVPCTSAC